MIQPGLERISLLLKNVEFPWKAIHIAGTNGKGSISHVASHLLRRRTVRTGTFTTPHLVDRWDSILINNVPVKENTFKIIENQILKLNAEEKINASPFEILTATALTCFNKAKVDIGIVEVGMGGRLDATNILNNQAISVISKIARDHEEFLGKTLAEIALHKAGILRPNVPYIVNPTNERFVQELIDEYAKEIGAGPRLFGDTPELRADIYKSKGWREYAIRQEPFQRDNTVLGIVAVRTAMKGLGKIYGDMIVEELNKKRAQSIPGRFQQIKVPQVLGNDSNDGRYIILDGGHNHDAAIALMEYVYTHARIQHGEETEEPPRGGWGVNWVVAMTQGKDAKTFLRQILRPCDRIITTSFGPVDGMPWVKPMDPKALLKIAQEVRPGVIGFAMPQVSALRALCASKAFKQPGNRHVMCGSLYLVGEFFREMKAMPTTHRFWGKDRWNPAQEEMRQMHRQEIARVNDFLRNFGNEASTSHQDTVTSAEDASRQVESELEDLHRQIDLLKLKENLPLTPRLSTINSSPSPDDTNQHNPHPSGRPFPGKFKELRERSKALRDHVETDEPVSCSSVETGQGDGTTRDPPIRYSNLNPLVFEQRGKHKIRLHFGDVQGQDRRIFARPTFLAKKKFGAQGGAAPE
ncbi:Mur ligase [Ampelomyces quisqualis]|uniref:Mur ligase n=1 Tax=Ampelomyces quisqualis TaxID=50730 RepID=A0A6A5R566_AMPQU|nr:Mur ligase [Ampelomyces quisqualis]